MEEMSFCGREGWEEGMRGCRHVLGGCSLFVWESSDSTGKVLGVLNSKVRLFPVGQLLVSRRAETKSQREVTTSRELG